MVEVRTEMLENNLIRHYATDGEKQYKIKQIETGIIYDDAVDVLPCRYTYEATKELAEITLPEEEMQQ